MRKSFLIALTISLLNPISSWASTVTVKPGETLSEIALRNNLSIQAIMKLNGIQDSNQLRAGQKLKLPDTEVIQEKSVSTQLNYTVKNGDTLTSIARKHKVSTNAIINENQLEAKEYLYVGQVLKIPSKNTGKQIAPESKHKVAPGETIGAIALRYNVTQENIMRLNRLESIDTIYIGQVIMIPQTQNKTKPSSIKKEVTGNPRLHVIRQGETLSSVALNYRVSLAKLIEINEIENPNQVNVGDRILLRKNTSKNNTKQTAKSNYNKSKKSDIKKSDWRKYGPLKVDWEGWRSMGGSYIAPSINKDGKALYLAINCSAGKLNATGANGEWKDWISPIDTFEHNLIKDLCKNKRS